MSRGKAGVTRPPAGFRRNTLSGWGLFFLAVSASAPMTAVAGGIVAAFAGTRDLVGVPAAFAVLTVALGLFSVGYVSMARYVRHAGPLYAQVARGLGPARGLGAAAVALLSYNAIQICLYGLFGFTMSGLGLGRWWIWALAAWLVVAGSGILEVRFTATLLALLLGCELVVVVAFDVFALAHPAGGHLDPGPLWPGHLAGDGVGAVLALAVACFVGYESTLAFAEEAVSHRTLARASFLALACLGVLYTASAWAFTAATGPARVNEEAATNGAGIIFDVLRERVGLLGVVLANLFFATSIFAAMLSLHQTVARYLFAMTRERLLPARVGRVGTRTGAPVGASAVQSTVALLVLGVWIGSGWDPMVLFTSFAALAAVGIMSLMAVSCLAAMGFYRRGGGAQESAWVRVAAPLCGTVALTVLVALTVTNLASLAGVRPGSWWVWALPGAVLVAAAGGVCWGLVVRARNPALARGIGRGEPEPLAVLEHHLVDIDL